MSIADIIKFPMMRVYAIAGISTESYAMKILIPESMRIHIGNQRVNTANTHDLLTIMSRWYHSEMSLSISTVSPEMLNDLKSQL